MRRSLALLVAMTTGLAGMALIGSSDEAAARTRVRPRAHTPTVVITPRYLTAGTAIPYYETRASVPDADPRFRSSGYAITSFEHQTPPHDPWYLPYPHTTIIIDSPLGRKLPGEQ